MPISTTENDASRSRESDGAGSSVRVPGDRPDFARQRHLTDDEILGLGVRERTRKILTRSEDPSSGAEDLFAETARPSDGLRSDEGDDQGARADDSAPSDTSAEPSKQLLDANPELKRAWQDAKAFRECFRSPEDARSATELLANVSAMDALFFSRRPEDHAELARIVAKLDPHAFVSLAKMMNKIATQAQTGQKDTQSLDPVTGGGLQTGATTDRATQTGSVTKDVPELAAVHHEFLQAANADAVKGVIAAIEYQMDRLLPEKVSAPARNRVVGEIYRELDASLQSNSDFSRQIRNAFQSGNFDANHRSAITSLIVGRARQVLPSMAKRVLNEWTSTILSTNHERRMKQRSAERRVDIDGSRGGSREAHQVRSPRDVDYARMSDADILNL